MQFAILVTKESVSLIKRLTRIPLMQNDFDHPTYLVCDDEAGTCQLVSKDRLDQKFTTNNNLEVLVVSKK